MARLSSEAWNTLRIMWESDPRTTFADVAKVANVSAQAIGGRAKKEGWKKRVQPSEMKRRAHSKADERTSPPVDLLDPDRALEDAFVGDGVDQRAAVLERHRNEWKGARSNIYKAIKNSDLNKARLGKTTAEALKIVQDGERKAWGLDDIDTPAVADIIRE